MNLSSTIIVVEGCDGAGKTTLIEHLAKYLRETLKLDVSTLKFPDYSTISGRKILNFLNGKLSVDDIERLFVENFEEKLAYLKEFSSTQTNTSRRLLLIDRYVASFTAYAMIRHIQTDQPKDSSVLMEKFDKMLDHFPRPNYTILLDVGEEERWRRISRRRDDFFQIDEQNASVQRAIREIYVRWFVKRYQYSTTDVEKYFIVDVTTLDIERTLNIVLDLMKIRPVRVLEYDERG